MIFIVYRDLVRGCAAVVSPPYLLSPRKEELARRYDTVVHTASNLFDQTRIMSRPRPARRARGASKGALPGTGLLVPRKTRGFQLFDQTDRPLPRLVAFVFLLRVWIQWKPF